MRIYVKVAPFVALLASLALACGGGGEGSDGGEAAAAAGEEGAAAGEQKTESPATKGTRDDAAINALIAGAGFMNTDKTADAQPVAKGPSTEKVVTGDTGDQFVCKYTDYSLTKVPEKFVALNPNADVLWPGSLVQGKSMAGGILDPIPVKRAPGTITLTLAAGGSGSFYKKMEEPSLSQAIQAQNEILKEYDGATPAKLSYSFESIYSSEQLAVAVDANVKGTNWSAAASLAVDKSDQKSRMLIQFTQEYFTMAFDPPQGAAGVFHPDVTSDDVAPYAAKGNPPVYVASVTYGRIFYLLFESNESQLDLAAAVKGSYSGSVSVDASLSVKYKNIVNNSKITAYGLGGNAKLALDAITGGSQFDKVATFLVDGANFDKANPGVPISYTIRHLTDSSQVKLALTTEYTAKNCAATDAGCATGQKRDACGVCGGKGDTCKPCGAYTFPSYVKSNGAYVSFTAAASQNGDSISFPDGSYESYHFPTCRRVFWGNMKATCNNGSWSMTSGTVSNDADCVPADKNNTWSSNGSSISAGWQP